MRRTDLIRALRRRAHEAGSTLELVRQGGEHELWKVGETTLSIPRHREISPGVTGRILRDLDAGLEDR